MRTRIVVLILTVVILISFGVSTFSSIISLSNLLEKSSSKEAQLFIEEVEKDITDSIFLTGCIPQQFSDVLHDCNLIS